MKAAAPLMALALAGCSAAAAPLASDITPPDAKYMQPIKPLISTPSAQMDKAGKLHLANLRNQCSDIRETATGLQNWAQTVTKKDDKR